MATVDASIPLQVRPVELPDPMAQYGRLLQIQGLKGQQEDRETARAATLADTQENTRLRELAGGVKPGADGSINLGELAPQALAVSPTKGAALVKTFGDVNTQQAAAQKAKIEQTLQQFDLISRVMSGVSDQASYDQAKAQLTQLGVDTANTPPQYDPSAIKMNQMRALSMKDQLVQKHQELTLAEQQRHNRTTEGNAAQGLGIQQQNANRMAEQGAQANSLKREELDLKKTAADSKQGAVSQKMDDEREVNRILDLATPLIDQATNSYAGAGVDQAARVFGASTKGAQAAAQLRALEGSLVSKMPKMSGPQSDKDVLLYKQMAGQIGDPTIPAEQKKAAMQAIREINSRYTGAQKAAPANTVASDSDYNALPSGAEFIAPDGSHRRKP